jgi:hypothetical protein
MNHQPQMNRDTSHDLVGGGWLKCRGNPARLRAQSKQIH